MIPSFLLGEGNRRLVVCAAAMASGLLGMLLIGFIVGEWWHLAGYFWYLLPVSFLPQEPAVIYAGTRYHAGLVVALFSLATLSASLIDYLCVKKVLELRHFAPLKETSFYRAAVRCFYWNPWWTLAVFAFAPLPLLPIRVLALSSNYPLLRYVSAIVAGRAPRYFLLAIGGAWLAIPLMYLLLIGFFLALIPTLLGILWSRRSPVRPLTNAA